MRRQNDPREDAAGEALAELRFDNGAFAIYDPDNEAAWLWAATPREL